MDSTKRVALVTGSIRGIGLQIAKELCKRGVKVALNDIDEPDSSPALDALSCISQAGYTANYYQCDVRDYTHIVRMVNAVVKDFGTLDILINNAGVLGKMASIVELKEEDWDAVIDVDLKGTFLVTKAVVPYMIDRDFGRIVNMASIAGKEGNANQTLYCSAKAGVIGFTKAIAKELAVYNIRINAVCPALIRTSLVESIPNQQRQHLLSLIPVGRFGETKEVADLVCFLALSEAVNFITGQAFNITGGRADY